MRNLNRPEILKTRMLGLDKTGSKTENARLWKHSEICLVSVQFIETSLSAVHGLRDVSTSMYKGEVAQLVRARDS